MNEQNKRQKYLDEIIKLLELVKSKINDQTDVIWTRFESPTAVIADIEADIMRLAGGDDRALADLSLKFAPTGTFQEISISNGWGQEFLEIAGKFDHLEEKLNTQ